MGINVGKVEESIAIKVLVQFAQKGGTTYLGDFTADCKRVDTDRIDELCDPDQNYRNSEVFEEIVVGVSGIGNADGSAMAPDDALSWVRKQPECVNATVTAFLRTMRPERYNEKTPRRARGRG